jgi:hypothetical protein
VTARSLSPLTREKRVEGLEREIQELKRQLHAQAVENVVDLQAAMGTLDGKDRPESAERLAKIPNDGLELIRATLVKALNRLNNLSSSPSPSPGPTRGDEPYIV